MESEKEKTEHPEKKNIKNICKITPKTRYTKEVCDKVNKEKEDAYNKSQIHE
ncbi:hypothetical protein OQJ18_02585 [Fluoribacter dumoffii]|uniref:Uncharacterized protein n=1 Tax=Fluoribacter dumoffii TaxID=463 RepID=A0A377GBV4_9GAMM|nr:hypothetical protein [Fluoribacter dumoffii]KTC88734.1 hypothetical protein Ldum_2992 [Fluoribacter dumoffii NY 23]MCW8385972.1 hypothetical protein [Fluoribacter dumoffii]MCW8419024.1 hypothetical protein [Fluoribacter dumoffii]MCW8453132.1 hypothetical protein [Fluoribacter dumoffii]MCW8459650.1 hypothetical protein [Fluoribacter dumoffii]